MTSVPATPLFADPRRLLLEMAREHALPDLLRLVVDRLAESPRVALARIWLMRRSEDCDGCVMPAECRDRTVYLHLVASAGRSALDPEVEWTRLDGAFRRFPLGVRKVGRIAATGEPVEALDLLPEPPAWAADPAWIRAEGIAGFGGQPLVHRGEVLGVLGVFARGAVGPDCMDWLRAIADGAAAAIATARAFERIEDLTRRLEQENEYLREEVTRAGAFGELVGRGPALEAVARQIDLVAPTDAAVLILGESGMGKELVAREVGKPKPRLTLADAQRLQRYRWPGNVRELQHVIERAVIIADGARLVIELPADPAAALPETRPSPLRDQDDRVLTDAEVRRLEADNIRAALRRTAGKVSGPGGAAELLGIK